LEDEITPIKRFKTPDSKAEKNRFTEVNGNIKKAVIVSLKFLVKCCFFD